MTTDVFKDVLDFTKAFGLPENDKPKIIDTDIRELRINLLMEEVDEYLTGEQTDDIVEIADALIDLIYIAVGTAITYGIPFEKVWNEVHRSNMAKLGPNGEVLRREDGKVKKPEGWQPPNIRSILEAKLDDGEMLPEPKDISIELLGSAE
jgi:predicted HAD superfamily Cof-like phosphohydrolase